MRKKIRIICTVGTSVTRNDENIEDTIRRWEANTLFAPGDDLTQLDDETLFGFVRSIYPPNEDPNRDKAFSLMEQSSTESDITNLKKCTFPTAETETVFRWMKKSSTKKDVSKLHLILLPSEDERSKLTAHATSVCMKRLEHLFSPDTDLECSRVDDIIPLDINVGNREEFLEAIPKLFDALDKLTRDAEEKGEETILCATGGFKAVSGYAIMYAQLHSLPCLYSYKNDSEAFEVMSIPLGYAYASMDEEINMLKAIKNYKDHKDHKDLYISSFPQWVQDSEKLADVFLESYKKAREKPYGTGEALFERLRSYGDEGKEWAAYLQSLLVHNWSQLWTGDQIPETVEHSRRHSKRLMEFAANLFRCAAEPLEALGFNEKHPELLALLIATIYLHDIGHTALSYPLFPNPDDDAFPLGLFPSSVREVHHLLTGELLRNESAKARYFTRRGKASSDDGWMADILMTCVPFIAEHHRGYTALKGEAAKLEADDKVRLVGELLFVKDNFDDTLRPLEDRYTEKKGKCPIETKHLLNLTALMRIIDGCDVQADRVISEDYLEYRNRRSDDEARVLKVQLDGLLGYLSKNVKEALDVLDRLQTYSKDDYAKAYSVIFHDLHALKDKYDSWKQVQRDALPDFTALSLANRVAFKGEQRFHFGKHQHVGFVLPTFSAGKVTVKVFPNDDFVDTQEKMTTALKGVCEEIKKEYDAVTNVLKDKIVFGAEIVGG